MLRSARLLVLLFKMLDISWLSAVAHDCVSAGALGRLRDFERDRGHLSTTEKMSNVKITNLNKKQQVSLFFSFATLLLLVVSFFRTVGVPVRAASVHSYFFDF